MLPVVDYTDTEQYLEGQDYQYYTREDYEAGSGEQYPMEDTPEIAKIKKENKERYDKIVETGMKTWNEDELYLAKAIRQGTEICLKKNTISKENSIKYLRSSKFPVMTVIQFESFKIVHDLVN